jgi:pyridine nucleotide-disulfide oxidoreductase family protein
VPNETVAMTKRVLLAGGGHAHLGVLAAFERDPPTGCEVTLLSPLPRQIYSGMLPGWVAGHYTLDECVIPLPSLATRAGVRFCLGHVARIDLDARIAFTEGAEEIGFDLISIDTGPVIDTVAIAGLAEHAIALRPFESLIGQWERLLVHLTDTPDVHTLTVIGGGAGGVELALAASFRAASARLPLRVQIVTGRSGAVPTLPGSVQRRLERILHASDIRLIVDDAVEIGRHTVLLADGGELTSDATIVATGAAAAEWPRASGLACDAAGFIAVNGYLQSISHPFVFAAGDCATMLAHPRPRSGVYAVRAGPPLARNLRRALAGRGLAQYRPQQRALYLLSAGGRYAIATWGSLCTEGAWVWRWKNSIDRRFVASLHRDDLSGKTA